MVSKESKEDVMARENTAQRLYGWAAWGPSDSVHRGEYDGECWRPACVNQQARWLNEQDAQYYCAACAKTLNEAARRFGEREPCVLLASSDPAVNEAAAND
jgi:hypothetical protein